MSCANDLAYNSTIKFTAYCMWLIGVVCTLYCSSGTSRRFSPINVGLRTIFKASPHSFIKKPSSLILYVRLVKMYVRSRYVVMLEKQNASQKLLILNKNMLHLHKANDFENPFISRTCSSYTFKSNVVSFFLFSTLYFVNYLFDVVFGGIR